MYELATEGDFDVDYESSDFGRSYDSEGSGRSIKMKATKLLAKIIDKKHKRNVAQQRKKKSTVDMAEFDQLKNELMSWKERIKLSYKFFEFLNVTSGLDTKCRPLLH